MITLFALALTGGKYWWAEEEGIFRRRLLEGAWPDLTARIQSAGAENILRLEVGKEFFKHNSRLSVIPDHGKMMHLFLVREGSRDAFAHLHPIRKDAYKFEVAVPPLPQGRYAIYCDLAFEGGVCSTATNSVQLPSTPVAESSSGSTLQRDPDDSWASQLAAPVPAATGEPICRLPGGEKVVWQRQKALRVNQDASLRFTVTDADGTPIALEPYMGMLSHAAVLRRDGSVFAHLHPAGNYSMAAQSYFENKLANETRTSTQSPPAAAAEDHSMHHNHSSGAISSVYLPYEFPEPGDYRIWVQFKNGARVLTAVFDAHVDP
jgi:hypothetical protein